MQKSMYHDTRNKKNLQQTIPKTCHVIASHNYRLPTQKATYIPSHVLVCFLDFDNYLQMKDSHGTYLEFHFYDTMDYHLKKIEWDLI